VRCLTIEWNKLTDEDFESLCWDVLAELGYKNLQWLGKKKGGDRGRDILAMKPMEVTETHEVMLRFLVQCKRYLANPPGPSDLQETLAWADAHNPDWLMIMVPNTLTSGTHDWLDLIRPQKKYQILVYDEKHLEQFFDKHGNVYAKHFGGKRVARERIICSMLDREMKSPKRLADETQLPEEQVAAILEKLDQEGLISREEGEKVVISYSLKTSTTAFAEIAKRFLTDESKFEFLASKYSEFAMNSDLADYVESRYHILLSKDQKQALIKLFGISPSALQAALFSPTDKYDTAYAHAEQIGLRGDERDRWNQLLLTEFMSTLLEKAIADLRDPDVKTTLEKNEVEGYDVGITIKMASSKGPVLNLGSELAIMLLKAGGPIKAGQLVSATDPGLFVRTGSIFLHLELFEQAMGEYDRAISELKDKQKLAAAWNNKGVCLMALRRWDKAIPCFDKALEIHPTLNEARDNKQKCEAALRQDWQKAPAEVSAKPAPGIRVIPVERTAAKIEKARKRHLRAAKPRKRKPAGKKRKKAGKSRKPSVKESQVAQT
jgi:tetratricopeptide (TPR) repeat protein